ncbi:hypothetical protein [Roseimicrobium sp. ORNL1]|uniref:hypothetical protein n=1 Tax=Roseimicrobium sp. ORNL1 TaxID=2711231 RepID=UPI0013E0EBEE|nr:hypothetical protein [Roseimicrobium sp. ORNL1]QIF05547.1 hypothetical protein G5S37_29960 [Roseimicrobium sp. ORNL1]
MERPRHRLISTRASPMVEMARWIFERYGIPYAEEAHAPLLHVLATRRAGGGVEVPVVVTSEGVWEGARSFLVGIDAKSRPGQRFLGETDSEREKTLQVIDEMLALLQQLLLFGAEHPSTPQFEGPFLDRLVVRLTQERETAL